MEKLLKKLQERERNSNLRSLVQERDKIDFFSNDYLGLAGNIQLQQTITHYFSTFCGKVNGSTGSRLLAGNTAYFEIVEQKLATLFNAEKCLLFNSGYNANLAILSAVPQKGDTILYDALIHASLIDGARLSFAKRYSFLHNDLEDLERLLKKAEGEKYVVAEAVYSMDGDFAPVKALTGLCEKYSAHLIIDEAHSTGIWGNKGSGLCCSLGLEEKIFARVHTFGKAMGIHGACIVGSETLIDFLINFARPFIYTTALPLHCLVAVEKAFEYLQENIQVQKEIKEKIETFLSFSGNYSLGAALIPSKSPIQAVRIQGNTAAKKIAATLVKAGYEVRAILSPTVKAGEERLRICLHTYNTIEEIKGLVQKIGTIV